MFFQMLNSILVIQARYMQTNLTPEI